VRTKYTEKVYGNLYGQLMILEMATNNYLWNERVEALQMKLELTCNYGGFAGWL